MYVVVLMLRVQILRNYPVLPLDRQLEVQGPILRHCGCSERYFLHRMM